MRTLILAAFCAALIPSLANAAAAAPAESGVTADARCLMTMAALSSAQDATAARSGQIGTVFFAGRIKAREPSFDFTTRLKALATTMTGDVLQNELKRCGPQVQAAMGQLDAAFQALSPAPAQTPAPAPGK